jgi:hypothetical protein
VLAAVTLAVVLIAFSTLNQPPKLVWLDPDQAAQPQRQGVLAQIKGRLAILTAPIRHRFRRTKPQICIKSTLMKLGPGAAEKAGLGAPDGTNADGLRAWLLSPDQLAAVRQRLRAIPGTIEMANPLVTTFDGFPANVGVGFSSAAAAYPDSMSLSVDLLGKIVSQGVRLQLCARWTAGTTRPANTNLVACRALVANGGGLLVDGGPVKDSMGRSCWFIFSTIEVDRAGNPVK